MKERSKAIKDLEAEMNELKEMFQNLASMIETQSNQIGQIEVRTKSQPRC